MTKIIFAISFFNEFFLQCLQFMKYFNSWKKRLKPVTSTCASLCVTLSCVDSRRFKTKLNGTFSFPNWCQLIIKLPSMGMILLTEFRSHCAVVGYWFSPLMSQTLLQTHGEREQWGDWPCTSRGVHTRPSGNPNMIACRSHLVVYWFVSVNKRFLWRILDCDGHCFVSNYFLWKLKTAVLSIVHLELQNII